MNHSIADAVCFCIHTPVGRVIMTGDFKIDPTAEGGMMDLGRLGVLGKEGVLALLCDSTNVERTGYTPSEQVVAEGMDRQFKNCNERIIVTTFASNMHRIQAVLQTAHRYGRKVAVTGRSMENMLKVATELNYLKAPANTIVDIGVAKSLPKDKVVIVSTGSQGENMSALYRMAFSTHKHVEIQPGDRIIISASAIPGNEKAISKIINELYRKGAEVIYEKSEGLHVSGHACQEELKIVHAPLTRPKFFIPVHGEQRHLQIHAKLAKQMGMSPKTFDLRHRPGDGADQPELQGNRHRPCRKGAGGWHWRGRRGQRSAPGPEAPGPGRHAGCLRQPVQPGRFHSLRPRYHHPGLCVCEGIGKPDGRAAAHRRGVPGPLPPEGRPGLGHHQILHQNDLSGYLFKTTKRNPMILPVIMEI